MISGTARRVSTHDGYRKVIVLFYAGVTLRRWFISRRPVLRPRSQCLTQFIVLLRRRLRPDLPVGSRTVIGPAQSNVSPPDAQPHRLPNQKVSANLSHVRKNELNIARVWWVGIMFFIMLDWPPILTPHTKLSSRTQRSGDAGPIVCKPQLKPCNR